MAGGAGAGGMSRTTASHPGGSHGVAWAVHASACLPEFLSLM